MLTVISPDCTSGVTLLFPLFPLSLLQLVLKRAKPQRSIKLKKAFFMIILIFDDFMIAIKNNTAKIVPNGERGIVSD